MLLTKKTSLDYPSSCNQILFTPVSEKQAKQFNSAVEDEFHSALWMLFKCLLHYEETVSAKMALRWVVLLLFVGCRGAVENKQTVTVSERCMQDTNTFLWEINKDEPKQYAALSKCMCIL